MYIRAEIINIFFHTITDKLFVENINRSIVVQLLLMNHFFIVEITGKLFS